MSTFKDRTGEVSYNTFGTKMKIIKYRAFVDIDVEFQDKYRYIAKGMNYDSFKRGHIKNPYDPVVCGKGFIGEEYSKNNEEWIKNTKSYKVWHGMIIRCYASSKTNYSDCSVCDEWLNYSNFKKWFDLNYYEIPNCIMQLDKDIKKIGNRVYSSDGCIFVPNNINSLFVTRYKHKYENIPIGVIPRGNKYITYRMSNNKRIFLGTFNTIEEAEDGYINGVINNLREILAKYKKYIPTNVYKVLNNYNAEDYKLFLDMANQRKGNRKELRHKESENC